MHILFWALISKLQISFVLLLEFVIIWTPRWTLVQIQDFLMLLEEQGILPLGSWTRYEYGLAYCMKSSSYLLLLQVGKDSLSREGGASVVVCDINKSMLQVSWLMFPKLAWDGITTIILQTSKSQ